MRRNRLPLAALRSFESAGRLLSFTSAAKELLVTQAAISRQIRELEHTLGVVLFERHHRRVTLTEVGTHLLQKVTHSLDALDDALQEVEAGKATSVLVVSVEPSFATCWLVSRLDRFRALHPEIDVDIRADPHLVEFRTSPAQLAIRHSLQNTEWPHVQARHLARCLVTPVIAPSLLARGSALEQPQDVMRHTLLHENGRRFWSSWLKEAGVANADTSRGPLYADHGLILPAVRRGHGIALGELLLIKDDLEAGQLVAPFDVEVQFGSYWLVAPSFETASPAAKAFTDWLQTTVQQALAS